MSHISSPAVPPGRVGTPMSVITNSFILTMPKKPLVFFHYDAINPLVASRGRRLEIVDRLQTHTLPEVFKRRAVYDGRNMFSLSMLKLTHETVIVSMSDRAPRPGSNAGQYQVTIKLVAKNSTNTLRKVLNGSAHDGDSLLALQLLNLLLRQAPIMKHPHNSRSFYLQDGMRLHNSWEIWRGVFMSARPSIGKMLVNIDITSAIMYRQGPLIDVCLEFLRQYSRCIPNIRDLERLDQNTFRRLKDFLKRLRIETNEGKKLRVEGIEMNAGIYRFGRRNPDGSEDEMTVEEYFRLIKAHALLHPRLPGVKHKGAVYPFELCTVIPGQFYKKAPPAELTEKVMEMTKMRPSRRIDEIRKCFTHLDFVNSDYVRHNGLEVATEPERVDGRLLPSPRMEYGGGKDKVIEQGAWNMRGLRLLSPKTLKMWSVVSFDPALSPKDVGQIVTGLVRCMKQLGISECGTQYIKDRPLRVVSDVQTDRPPLIQGNASGDLEKQVRQAFALATPSETGRNPRNPTEKHERPHLLLFILPAGASELYRDLKYFGDTVVDVPTQCITAEKLQAILSNPLNRTLQFYSNVTLKINGKLGGINCKVSNSTMKWFGVIPSMVVGIDVSHPGPGVQRPSFAGMAWSVDRFACQYYTATDIQHPRQEIVNDLTGMMITALTEFKAINKSWPHRVFIFRDGVSEGEYHQVANEEYNQILVAISAVMEDEEAPRPKITLIIVGKRHHVRFIPISRDGEDKSGNVPAGFVTDTGITTPGLFNFYLQSHAGIIGTSRSSHYVVLKDENDMDADRCQQFAFSLCHVYAPSTRSVSVPAPLYYADRLCRRADIHLKIALDSIQDDQSTDSGAEFNLDQWKAGFRPACPNQSKQMYFL